MRSIYRKSRWGLLAIGLALLLGACANQQLQTKTQQNIPTTQVLTIDLQSEDLRRGESPSSHLLRSLDRKKTSKPWHSPSPMFC